MSLGCAVDSVIHGDCKEVIKSFPLELFDAILTDPPYGVTGDNDDYIATDFLAEAYRVLKPNSALMMCVGQATLRQFWNEAEKVGFKWLNTVIWHYKNTFKRERRRFAIQYDPILYFAKGDFEHRLDAVRVPYLHPERLKYPTNNAKKQGWMPDPNGALCGDVWEFPAITSTSKNGVDFPVGHKWQKPIELFERMVKATTDVGGLILDPFCGSGTSCIAAKKHGVHYVGIDIDEICVSLATDRLDGKINGPRTKKKFMDMFEDEV